MFKFSVPALCCLTLLFFTPCLFAAGEKAANQEAKEENVYISKGYNYQPNPGEENADLGLFFCGTRCNALSVDYLNITSPGGWRMLQVKKDHQVTVSLDKLGLKGTCTCVVDEYKVVVNEFYMSKQ